MRAVPIAAPSRSVCGWHPARCGLSCGAARASGRQGSPISRASNTLCFSAQDPVGRTYEILHCHDYPMLAPAVAAKRWRPTPLVYDAHELYHAQIQLPERTQRRYRARERRLIKRADLAITVNPFLADIMAKDYGCAAPAVILNAAPAAASSGAGLRERLACHRATGSCSIRAGCRPNGGSVIWSGRRNIFRMCVSCLWVTGIRWSTFGKSAPRKAPTTAGSCFSAGSNPRTCRPDPLSRPWRHSL